MLQKVKYSFDPGLPGAAYQCLEFRRFGPYLARGESPNIMEGQDNLPNSLVACSLRSIAQYSQYAFHNLLREAGFSPYLGRTGNSVGTDGIFNFLLIYRVSNLCLYGRHWLK